MKRALTGGWLVNREEREGRHYPAKLARGAPLPEDLPVLPAKDALMPPPGQPDPPIAGVEQAVKDGATEATGVCSSGEHRDSSRHSGVEQQGEQQLKNAVPIENESCSTGLVDTGNILPSPPSSLDPEPGAEGDDRAHASPSEVLIAPPTKRTKKKITAQLIEVGLTYDPGPYTYI